jgi:ribosomal protein L9
MEGSGPYATHITEWKKAVLARDKLVEDYNKQQAKVEQMQKDKTIKSEDLEREIDELRRLKVLIENQKPLAYLIFPRSDVPA